MPVSVMSVSVMTGDSCLVNSIRRQDVSLVTTPDMSGCMPNGWRVSGDQSSERWQYRMVIMDISVMTGDLVVDAASE
jgi:hypothetical protein